MTETLEQRYQRLKDLQTLANVVALENDLYRATLALNLFKYNAPEMMELIEAYRDLASASWSRLDTLSTQNEKLRCLLDYYETFNPISEYHEDYGYVLWWKMPVCEPPYCGKPEDSDWKDGYYTHFTPIVRNAAIKAAQKESV